MSVNTLLAVDFSLLRWSSQESAQGEERYKNQSGARDKLRHSWQIIDLSIRNGEGRFFYLTPLSKKPSSSHPATLLYPTPAAHVTLALCPISPKFSLVPFFRVRFCQLPYPSQHSDLSFSSCGSLKVEQSLLEF